jgi:peptidyl serine alpha-galactosyltransferase
VFFYQAWQSGQTGRVTRVASGCKDEQAAADLRATFQEQIVHGMNTGRFDLHITPDYSKLIDGLDYKFFNKPLGLRHWMEEELHFPTQLPKYERTIFAILDPDQYILRPFQEDYTGDATMSWHGTYLGDEFRIQKGKPFAQLYSFGAHFVSKINMNVSAVVDAATYTAQRGRSHLYDWTAREVERHYAAGPPYLAVASDMYDIVKTWAEIAVPVYELTTGHLSEMYAYSTAAAHLNLPHQLVNSFMISDPDINKGEGWTMIDAASPSQVCEFDATWTATLPQVVHYCQRYFLGPYFFNKYKLPKQFLSCDQALIKDPILTEGTLIATRYSTAVTPNGEMNIISPVHRKRHAFVLCQTISKVNAAVTYWKKQHCDAATANFNKTYEFPFDQGKEHLKPLSY